MFARRCFCDHNYPQPLAVATAVNDRSGGTITVHASSGVVSVVSVVSVVYCSVL